MLHQIKSLVPSALLRVYHYVLARAAVLAYGHPSRRLVVIGVTGTNGKSTTVNLISKILEHSGEKVGFTTTINFKVGDREWLNDTKMTMLGRFKLQKLLKEMVDAECRYAVIETSSQGLDQYRHLGIEYDAAVFTNLAPEHLEAHGGFENYKNAKAKLFRHLTDFPNKVIDGKKIPKIIAVNADDEYSGYFYDFPADRKISYSIENFSDFKADNITLAPDYSAFDIYDTHFEINLPAKFNIYNSLAAIAVTSALGVKIEQARDAFAAIKFIPGRLEYIEGGQNFKIMVDYAPEPNSLAELYSLIKQVPKNKLIHVLGSAGGGRDKARRPILGRMAGEVADYVIVTNEDPYDEDPMEIIDAVAKGAIAAGKVLDENLFKRYDRKEAIEKAIGLADEGDFVLVTGKGAEQAIAVAKGKKIKWDDRKVIREILKSKIR